MISTTRPRPRRRRPPSDPHSPSAATWPPSPSPPPQPPGRRSRADRPSRLPGRRRSRRTHGITRSALKRAVLPRRPIADSDRFRVGVAIGGDQGPRQRVRVRTSRSVGSSPALDRRSMAALWRCFAWINRCQRYGQRERSAGARRAGPGRTTSRRRTHDEPAPGARRAGPAGIGGRETTATCQRPVAVGQGDDGRTNSPVSAMTSSAALDPAIFGLIDWMRWRIPPTCGLASDPSRSVDSPTTWTCYVPPWTS